MQNKLSIVFKVLAPVFLSIAYASGPDKKPFDGWGIQFGYGRSYNSSPITIDYSEYLQSSFVLGQWQYFDGNDHLTVSESATTSSIGLSHAYSLGQYNLGLSFFYDMGTQFYGPEQIDSLSTYRAEYELVFTSLLETPFSDNSNVMGQVHFNNLYSIAIEPGYYLPNNVLVYSKLGAAWTKPELQITGGDLDTIIHFGLTTGFLYGVGMKYEFMDHWYVGAEAYQVKFPTLTNTSDFISLWENYPNLNHNTDVTATYQYKSTYSYVGIIIGYQF